MKNNGWAICAVPTTSWGAAGAPSPIGFNGPPVHACQYIEGEPSRWARKCGRPTKLGSSFCPAHHAICWKPISEARAMKMMGLVP